jgi:hypothetical protein
MNQKSLNRAIAGLALLAKKTADGTSNIPSNLSVKYLT